MGFFVSWINILPFFGPQLAMLEIAGNYLPHLFTVLHILGLINGSVKYQRTPDDVLLSKTSRASPYILFIITFSLFFSSARDNFFAIIVIFACLGLLSGLSVSRWLAWFSSKKTEGKRNIIFGASVALTYILMSITSIFTNWLLNSPVLWLTLSSILVLAGGKLIDALNIPQKRKVSFQCKAILPSPGLILFALFAYSSISLLYDQLFDWSRQITPLPFLLIIPYLFIGLFLARWISSKNRTYFAIIAFFLVGFGFLSYLLDPVGYLSITIISFFISSGLLCFHIYYWISLVESQKSNYAPITVSIGISFELAVFAIIYTISPFLNLDINRPGLLIGISGLIFVLLGLVIVAMNVQQVNTKLMNRFAYVAAPDKILSILHFHDTNFEITEDLLKNKFNLTVREVEVASHLLLGYKNKDIQEKLCITMNTLKYHIRNIYSKLGVNNREGAIDVVYKVLNDYERQQASGKMNI